MSPAKTNGVTETQEARVHHGEVQLDVQGWRLIPFTFDLFRPTNRQNDCVWANHVLDVPPAESVKQPPKIIVWRMRGYNGL